MSTTYGEGAKDAATVHQINTINHLGAPGISLRVEETGGPNGALHVYVRTGTGHERIRHWVDPDGTVRLTEYDEEDTGEWAAK